jgi:hypothetical protein
VKPLDARQTRAATRLGRGDPADEVAAEASVSKRTLTNWRGRDDFAEIMAGARAKAIDQEPTMRAVLEDAAHNATRPDGSTDWSTRVAAARALIGADGFGAPPEPPPPETEYFLDDEDDGDAAPPTIADLYEAWDGTISQAATDLYEHMPLYVDLEPTK